MLSYFTFVHSGIESAGNALSDGENLALGCIQKLAAVPDRDEFPPKLLVLLASPAYLDSLKAEQLLNGVVKRFRSAGHRDLPLIGCSVAAVFFDRRIYREGALLACFASRLFDAKVSAAPEASRNPEKAVDSLLEELEFTSSRKRVHSFVNRSILAFFPGFGGKRYLAPKLHDLLRDALETPISIFGGVASANDVNRLKSGILFANGQVYRDALVLARLEHGTPFGISLAQGLTDTHKTVAVAHVDAEDLRIIHQFQEGSPKEVMGSLSAITPVPLFADLALDHDPTVDLPVIDGDSVRLNREVERDHHSFHVLAPDPVAIRKDLHEAIGSSMNRAFLENPIGALGFRCTGLLRNEKKVNLDLEHDVALIEQILSLKGAKAEEKPYVGGFVDGEAGLDQQGKSVIGNWSSATLLVGDELRFRTPVYRGFEKVTEFAGMTVADSQKDGLDRLTKLIYDIGFPGAMLSFCVFDQEARAIVGRSASGPRYQRLLKRDRVYLLSSDDILATVVREKRPQAVIDSRLSLSESMKAAARENIVSQYLIPLIAYDGQVMAILQIDLGDLSYDSKLYETETTVLDALGNIVGAALNRTLTWEESKLINSLDRAMNACQSAETVEHGLQLYLEHVLDTFGLNKGNAGGHIRIAHEDEYTLRLVAGSGSYFEAAHKWRRRIDFADRSPTIQAFRDQKPIIINNAQHNKAHRSMCERLRKTQQAVHAELLKVDSYANVPFASQRGERGTINLVANDPWFFGAFHRTALEALGQRLGFLLESLRRKERESFLRDVSPPFSQIPAFDDIGEVLRSETRRFAGAINAEIASLYLWDEDRERYILKAEEGWEKPEWLDAAYYSDTQFWTATSALAGKPHYITDLFRYYRQHGAQSRHAVYAFGQPFSRKFTVEAIALQLRIGSDRLGALTFYRRIKPGDESGFVTTDTDLLQQGADNFSSLIAIVENIRREKWRKHEHARRQQVFDSLSPATAAVKTVESFEQRVTRQLLESYHAASVAFHGLKVEAGVAKAEPKLLFERDASSGSVSESKADPDEMVKEAIRINFSGERKLLTERLKIAEENTKDADPKLVALEGLVKRVVVPLFSQGNLIGALDVRWAFERATRYTVEYQHGEAFLLMLGDMIGAAYDREQVKRQNQKARDEEQEMLKRTSTELREEAMQTRNAFAATTAYVLRNHHDIRNVLNRIYEPLNLLQESGHNLSKKQHQLLERIFSKVEEGIDTLDQMIEIGPQMISPAFVPLPVGTILQEALRSKQIDYADTEVSVEWFYSSEEPIVWADSSLLQIAFDCLIDNAYKFMKDKHPRRLNIHISTRSAARDALIIIEDSGIGMTEEKIELLREEFCYVDGSVALGVLLSKLVLGRHGGSLRYESVLGDYTKAFVTLPLDLEQRYE